MLGVRSLPETEARRLGSSPARRSRRLRELMVVASWRVVHPTRSGKHRDGHHRDWCPGGHVIGPPSNPTKDIHGFQQCIFAGDRDFKMVPQPPIPGANSSDASSVSCCLDAVRTTEASSTDLRPQHKAGTSVKGDLIPAFCSGQWVHAGTAAQIILRSSRRCLG